MSLFYPFLIRVFKFVDLQNDFPIMSLKNVSNPNNNPVVELRQMALYY